MIRIDWIVILLVSHWVGDYALQTNAIAERKAASLLWLSLHVVLYSIALLLGCLFFLSPQQALWYCAVNAALHFATDFVTGKLAFKFKSRQRIFYLVIGMDQLIHVVTLMVSAYYVLAGPMPPGRGN